MTAQLVQLYDASGPQRRFEIVLFGYDEDQKAMEAYLKKSHMAFPAVKLEDLNQVQTLYKTGNTGFIPNAVLVSREGKLITNDLNQLLQKLRNPL